jgi:hypothetical protein
MGTTLDQRDLSEAMEALRESLGEQIRRHEELRAEVDWMRTEMSGASPVASRVVQDEGLAKTVETAGANGGKSGEPGGDFDDGALLEAGVHRSDAERLREVWERAAFDGIAVKHAARREGWYHKKRLKKELNAIWWDMRREAGDEGFDALLYATGQLNRVLVTAVIARSSAAHAGLEKGDHILRYAGKRIFTPRELEQATASGVPGSTVAVEVLRKGQTQTLSVRRGPLGVVTNIIRAPPAGG